MRVPDLVSGFLARLVEMDFMQSDLARLVGCSEELISKAKTGSRSLPLQDFAGLLLKLCRRHPELRAQLVEAAFGPLLAELGCELVFRAPPPAAPSNLVVLDEYRASRALPVRRAA